MTTLPIEFSSVRGNGPVGSLPGYTFTQIDRKGDIALYAKRRGVRSAATYEVFRVRSMPFSRFPDGRELPEREAMPADENWGTDGWSYQRIEDAHRKFEVLTR